MTQVDLLTTISSVASIVLAIVAIWMAWASENRARSSEARTNEVLRQIDKRSEVTEQVVGAHFDRLMTTVLDIVNTATTDKEVRAAQIEAQTQDRSNQVQMKIMEMLSEVVQSGDKEKAETFSDIITTFTQQKKGR